LNGAGYQTLSAGNVQEAREILAKQHLDLVISDIRMPEEDGMSLLDFMSYFYPRVGVIMITGNPGMRTDIQVYLGGAIDFLLKPVDNEDLLESVRRCTSVEVDHNDESGEAIDKLIDALKELQT
jgi:DNA-binding NtrC family response regulator